MRHPSAATASTFQRPRRRGFTLIELLVVIAIIALLIAILLPALSLAQRSAESVACLSNYRQLLVGTHAYAVDHDDAIPRGPQAPFFPGVPFADVSHNLLWVPPALIGTGAYTCHGGLLDGYVTEPRIMTCPGAPAVKVSPEVLEDVGSATDWVIVAYMYRNLDQATRDRIDDLGTNDAGGDARVLLFDLQHDIPSGNPIGVPAQRNVNHDGAVTNAGYIDGHAESFRHTDDRFMLRQVDYATSAADLLARVDVVIQRFDQDDPMAPTD